MAPSDGWQWPATPPTTPGLPENATLFVFDGFEGLNTQPTRPAIGDQQMFWCDNLMPLGRNNLRALADVSGAVYTTQTGGGITHFAFANIGAVPIAITVESGGRMMEIRTDNGVVQQIAPAGTITDPLKTCGFSQWGSEYALIVAPQQNGYFVWDRRSLFKAGTVGPLVTIDSGGLDYLPSSLGTLTITPVGGTGTGATFSGSITGNSIATITVTNPGSGYSAVDFVVLAFAGGSSRGQTAIATSVINSTGSVVAVTMVSGGYGYGSGATVAFRGGGGTGATGTIGGFSGTSVASVTVSSGGRGYSLPPTVVFTDTQNPVARASVAIMPFGVNGTSIETYASRVWIVNGADIEAPVRNRGTFSAAGAVADFSPVNGGGSFTSKDSFLKVGYFALKQSNGFLYFVGDSSVNHIGGVTTSGTPSITTFSNQNVDPQIGSPWPFSVQVYSRAIVMANSFGIHALYGGAVQKVSGPLDGIYTTVQPKELPIEPSAAVASIYGVQVYMLLLPIIDTITNRQRNALLCWDGKKWWTAGPHVTLTRVATQEIESRLTAWGTDGLSLFRLFETPSTRITKTVQSKWWDRPSYIVEKQSTHVAGLLKSLGLNNANVFVTVDSEKNSQTVNATDLNLVTWVNNANQIVTWVTNSGDQVTWVSPSTGFFIRKADVSGQLIGVTAKSTTPDFILNSLTVIAQIKDFKT